MSEASLDSKGVIVKCRSCGQRNRIAYGAFTHDTRCGQCKSALSLPAEALDIRTDDQFRALTTQGDLPALVDFWAQWCPPCRAMAPALAQVAAANAGKFIVAKANTEELPNIAGEFEVRSIPTLVVLYKGKILARAEGGRPAAEILRFVNDAIATVAA